MNRHDSPLVVLLLLAAACSSGNQRTTTTFTVPDGRVVPPGSTQTAVATAFLFGGDETWVIGVPESDQGGLDLNGDGDKEDVVLHVFDSVTEEVTNLELAAGGYPISPAGSDTERDDLVPPPYPKVHRRWCVTFVGEAGQAQDLNGDGDIADSVLFVFDTRSRQLLNLKLASSVFADDGLWFYEDQMLFSVDELRQGADLDGSGALDVSVGFRYDLAQNRLYQLSPGGVYAGAEVFDDQIAYAVTETVRSGDLDGDGDLRGHVFHVYDFGTERLRSSGVRVTGSPPVRVDGQWVFSRLEETTDWNGDGELADTVLHVFDPLSGVVTNLGVAEGIGRHRAINEGTITFGVSEFAQGVDLNGDGDEFDTVAHLYRPATGLLTSSGLAIQHPGAVIPLPGVTALFVDENGQSQDLDASGFEFGAVLHELDLVTGLATNLGYEGTAGVRIERWLTFVRAEGIAGLDWNGDGDQIDPILFTWDTAEQRLVNTTWPAVVAFESQGSRVAFVSWEQLDDLNGDGDANDLVAVLYDLATDAATVLPFQIGSVYFAADGKLIGQVSEIATGVDWNGDGDELDVVLQVYGFGTGGTGG